ncbi:MAG TPA: MFS transporter [Blastocatellia bacterium]|nr:MFS transporter [Blastocatellia bacterium]
MKDSHAATLVSSKPGSQSLPARSRARLTRAIIRSLVAVLVGSLILRVAAETMNHMLQLYFKEINDNHYPLSYTVMGFITASFFISELLGAPILGALSDRYGRKVFILLGPLFGAVAVQITSMTVVIWLLVITRLLEGLSTASSVPSTLGYISEATSGRPALRARIVGLFEITLVGGMAAGSIVGGYLWKYFGTPVEGIPLISPAFSINGLIYLISLAVFAWGLKDIARKTGAPEFARGARSKLDHYLSIIREPAVWKFIPAWLAVFAIIGMWSNLVVRLLTDKSSYNNQLLMGNYLPDKIGIGKAILFIIFALGIVGWSFILGRYRKTSVMLVAMGGLFVTLLSAYGLNHIESFSSPFYYLLLISLVLAVLVLSGFTPAALTYLADVTESHSEDRGSIMGLYSVFLGVGQLIGTTSGGYFADWAGIDGLLLLSAIFGLMTCFILVALRAQEKPDVTIEAK